MKEILKSIAARLPLAAQQQLKRHYFAWQIRKGTFYTDEQEFALLGQFLSDGDWMLDIGANVGHYTLKCSNLVGASGRVVAFEPVPATFEVLTANVQRFPIQNVTLMNLAVSDECQSLGMQVPHFDGGLKNYYQASLTRETSELCVMTIAIDSIPFPRPVKLVKIDTEGHELSVLRGMRKLIERDRPVLIVEASSERLFEYLRLFGYGKKHLERSSNYLFQHAG